MALKEKADRSNDHRVHSMTRRSAGWSMAATGSLCAARRSGFADPLPDGVDYPEPPELGSPRGTWALGAALGDYVRHIARHLARPKPAHVPRAPPAHGAARGAALGKSAESTATYGPYRSMDCPARAWRSGHRCPGKRPGAKLWASREPAETSSPSPLQSDSTPHDKT